MVRLKVEEQIEEAKQEKNFNSSMVRLKVSGWCTMHLVSEFQFQYGAIESVEVLSPPLSLFDFNSSMVRLKEVFNKLFGFIVLNFNSSMVRLKVTSGFEQDAYR